MQTNNRANGRRAIEAYTAMRFDTRPAPLVERLWLMLAGFSLALVACIAWAAL